MFGPDWGEGCSRCSSAADGIGRLRQLHVRNTTLVAVSRATYSKLRPCGTGVVRAGRRRPQLLPLRRHQRAGATRLEVSLLEDR
ncbi:DUF899 family protein [Kribbella deserti]|uniref:DUF899 family protein n=1 Tax=Kribbella deserti TaxID=1926257 RepID=A0ABV6QMT4_9ACTN